MTSQSSDIRVPYLAGYDADGHPWFGQIVFSGPEVEAWNRADDRGRAQMVRFALEVIEHREQQTRGGSR